MRPIYFYLIGIAVGAFTQEHNLSLGRGITFWVLVIVLIELLFKALRKQGVTNEKET